jgi:group I intron endonuclease
MDSAIVDTSTAINLSARGIYAIVNTITNVWYIGMTTTSFRSRWLHHVEDLKQSTHHNKGLQRDFNMYGTRAFVFRVIEQIDDTQLIPVRERYYISAYSNHYLLFNIKDNPKSWY